ncbi:MAG TPA: alpha-2-macroglobulin family protein [Candidatus Paceibacterota bacterium]|nr:alpha-2-macroglobulin family protein [Candidatus Paceibacterota bacterium]
MATRGALLDIGSRVFMAAILLTGLIIQMNGATRQELWQAVQAAEKKRQPRTAITNLEPIIQAALKDKAYGEATKAILERVRFQTLIQGGKPEEAIQQLKSELTRTPAELSPVLHTVLAHNYWTYFQMNRYRFLQRTATAGPAEGDFTTWDLPRLYREIDRHFQTALSRADELKKIPAARYAPILNQPGDSWPFLAPQSDAEDSPSPVLDKYRPTLYDILTQEALSFYTSGEQAAAKPQENYEIEASGPIFDNPDRFITWARALPIKQFPDSPLIKALQIFGELMVFHAKDEDPSAYADMDLSRLRFGHNQAVGEDRDPRYWDSLKTFVERWADHETSALALYYWAQMLKDDGQWAEARQLALRGVQTHPESEGGKRCRNLVGEIEAKALRITTEKSWNCGRGFGPGTDSDSSQVNTNLSACPTIQVTYRNLTHLNFRVIAWEWEAFLSREHTRPENLNDREKQQLLAKTPLLEWNEILPPTTDFKERWIELPAPSGLAPGHYFIVASPRADFSDQDNVVSYVAVWVGELTLVVRPRMGNIEGLVLNANSGEPVSGAEITAWYLNRNGIRIAEPKTNSDGDGFFLLQPSEQRAYLIRAQHQGHTAYSQEIWAQGVPQINPSTQTLFFTDRALYRPGQTIRYKGLCLRVNKEQNDYQLLNGRTISVVLADPHGEEIGRMEHQCNDYGSFQGSFVAPRDRLMGRYVIRLDPSEVSETAIQVEEYKRPKFLVTLEAPKRMTRLNEEVVMTGKAEAYTGAAIDGAGVAWRVVREPQWPVWWGWWSWRRPDPRIGGSQEIAHGVAETQADGTFPITFVARPDRRISEADEVAFRYTVYADITDSAGETRSAERSVQIGYVSLRASLEAAEWQSVDAPVELTVSLQTLDGEPQVGEGVVKVHRLKEPAKVHRKPLREDRWLGIDPKDPHAPSFDLSDPSRWDLGDVATEAGFTSDNTGKARLSIRLPAGIYRAVLETRDKDGKKVSAMSPLQVLDPQASKLAFNVPNLIAAPQWETFPDNEFTAFWGTGYDRGRAFIEIEHRNKVLRRFWTEPGRTQQSIQWKVTESLRGGFIVHVTQVRENRAYLTSRHVDVPWRNKELNLKWEHFTSKLEPQQKETWSLVVKPMETGTGTQETGAAEKWAAEMVATLYDASLDQFLPHEWPRRFDVFYQDYGSGAAWFANSLEAFRHIKGRWQSQAVGVTHPRLRIHPRYLNSARSGLAARYGLARGVDVASDSAVMISNAEVAPMGAPMMAMAPSPQLGRQAGETFGAAVEAAGIGGGAGAAKGVSATAPKPDLTQVAARKNLQETAFFYPQLTSDSNGIVRISFAMPEALTTWRFLGFAHDRQLRSGFLEDRAITAKELMVQPNPPRFLREGDLIEFTVKISNQSAARQNGRVQLDFKDAATDQEANAILGNTQPAFDFDIPAKESRSYAWKIKVPDAAPCLVYRVVASTGRLSDGEEGYLPVLARRVLVTESLPLPIRGPSTRKYDFASLRQSDRSRSLQHVSYTLQMVSNPAWYAVLALPYLMEYPHECAEQVFNRLYANALARHVAAADPKIRRLFDLWKGTAALDSPLEKNQDLKGILIEETPWLRQAHDETRARQNLGALLDDNRLESELQKAAEKLIQMQLEDGAWPWFPGGRANDYITLYIVTGFGRLRHLGAEEVDVASAVRSLNRLDAWMGQRYRDIHKEPKPEDYVPSSTDALFLYGRSFFLKDHPLDSTAKTAVEFFLKQTRLHGLKVNSRQSQAHLAIALKRWGGEANLAAARDLMRSLRERAVTDDEMGMFWRDTELSWWWYRAPIETQALMIEAFDEVEADSASVEACKVWLLKQKQTQDWKTTKATADAVYALLLRGRDWLASNRLLEVSVGDIDITPQQAPIKKDSRQSKADPVSPASVEPGTGFYEKRFAPSQIKAALAGITVKKLDEGIAWGSAHWQYLEDAAKVKAYTHTPLKLTKTLFRRVNTPGGPVLEPVQDQLRVGDELVVRIKLSVDRDMEYIHLKDHRGSGTEPTHVLSGYQFQDGLAYYESTRDTASHFFVDYLPKGAYVFEYSTRVQHRGQYQTGLATIQSMYAPEFSSHSESFLLKVE